VSLTDLDPEGDKLKATFDSKHAGEEDIHVVKRGTVLGSLTLILDTTDTQHFKMTFIYISFWSIQCFDIDTVSWASEFRPVKIK